VSSSRDRLRSEATVKCIPCFPEPHGDLGELPTVVEVGGGRDALLGVAASAERHGVVKQGVAVLHGVMMVEHEVTVVGSACRAPATEDLEDELLVAVRNTRVDSEAAVTRNTTAATVDYSVCLQLLGPLQAAVEARFEQCAAMRCPPVGSTIAPGVAASAKTVSTMLSVIGTAVQAGIGDGRPSPRYGALHRRQLGRRPDDGPHLSDTTEFAAAPSAAVAGHAVPLSDVPPLGGPAAEAALVLLAPAHLGPRSGVFTGLPERPFETPKATVTSKPNTPRRNRPLGCPGPPRSVSRIWPSRNGRRASQPGGRRARKSDPPPWGGQR